MNDYQAILRALVADERYQRNIDWGRPRHGHPEATIRAHIASLEANLERLRPKLSAQECDKLRLLIHAHDTFKAEATPGVPITDPRSHASLGRQFLAEFCDDADLLAMVQFHDEPFALFRQVEQRGGYNVERFNELIGRIQDWTLFSAFLILDGCTEGKSREPLTWFFGETAGKVNSRITASDILA